MEEEKLYYTKLSSKGIAPKRATAGSAGYDLYSADDYHIPSRSSKLVSTNIIISIPAGCYGRIAPRSSFAVKYELDVGAGVIDSDYRGEVKILLFNHGWKGFVVRQGDRIAQLIIEKIKTPEVVETSHLAETTRGSDGFGSTGIN